MKPPRSLSFRRIRLLIALGTVAAAIWVVFLAVRPTAAAEGSPLHPTFPLLDAEGNNVLLTGNPVSTMETCGACHDTDFIAEHNVHTGVLTGALPAPSGQAVMIDTAIGTLTALDEAEGVVEMNCFLCHSTAPNNRARLEALAARNFEWANTATLVETGVVEQVGEGYTWNPAAFDDEGTLKEDTIGIQDPSVENCAQCHGFATSDVLTPLVLDTCGTEQRTTITTGQIFSPQRISDSGLNISSKDDLFRAWDVHAERVVGCTDCHYSLNNPAYATEPEQTKPDHLVFDPRRLEPGEYLERPLHEFARSDADPITEGGCQSCHEVEQSHQWLPYTDRHMGAVACETCHVARLESPARQSLNWTVLDGSGGPQYACRGHIPDGPGNKRLITGYEPVILPRDDGDGTSLLAPYNLITTWYWVYGDASEPVPLNSLQEVFFEAGAYDADILAALDSDGNGELDSDESVIDTEAEEALIAGRLAAIGYEDPRIVAKVDAYPINHSVTHGEFATRDCETCHGEDSRLSQPFELAGSAPGGILPTIADGPLSESGELVEDESGSLHFQPNAGSDGTDIYIFGYSRERFVDVLGMILFLGTLAGATVHSGLRYLAARRNPPSEPEIRELYLYSVYERLWHWLQTGVILLLILTGLMIHRPDLFGVVSFRWVVLAHNVLAGILVVNAALAAFYHLASGEIKQFLPQPRGFFNQAIEQALYYVRGIFRGEEHPFEKTPQSKLNPLQQVTYVAILNVLLPAQVITGAVMWGAQRWPELATRLGGLSLLAPVHTMVAWLFASFIVMHVYLTTTGPKPLASVTGMILGWDKVESHAGAD